MDASILIVGSSDFSAELLEQIHRIQMFAIVAPNSSEAMPLIQAQQPDLIVLQANTDSLELCSLIKQQKNLSWIYCILVDQLPIAPVAANEMEKILELRAEALEKGADAYLNLSQDATGTGGIPDRRVRLLQAQIKTGLRSVLNHRELMRTNDILSAIALSDPLTELNNRRAFDWELPRQIKNSRDRSEPLSLLMLDVDYFKSINDTYGHRVGDQALQLVSARLRHNLRFHDTLFRYGGEEFVIILSKTEGQEADLVARRLCRLIGGQPFTISDKQDLNITISAGAASLLSEDDAKGASLIHRADQNLLRAKATGRNRVVSSFETASEERKGDGVRRREEATEKPASGEMGKREDGEVGKQREGADGEIEQMGES
ncbi:MAG: diguanylate cyclase [Scytolyngbya sp. HA4215-MV1]|jgi:two-component system cell cycle response regulator|nr:diguanylate cyclase [Scytolyngbya sp. HA4215-MV1]